MRSLSDQTLRTSIVVAINAYYELVNAEQEVVCLMLAKQAKHKLFERVKALHAYKQEDGQSVSFYLLKMKGYLDHLECLAELHTMLKLTEKGLPKKAAIHSIRGGKIQKDKNKLRDAKGSGKGKNKQAWAPNPKIPLPPKKDNPVKDSICHH
ncbi:hypothetical protein Tco_0518240 [Tanacetum coccineum]